MRLVRFGFVLVIFVLITAPTRSRGGEVPEDEKPRLKRSQIEEILRSDRTKSIADAARLEQLASEFREELEKTDSHVFSVSALKKAEEMEKIAKRIRGRMRRF